MCVCLSVSLTSLSLLSDDDIVFEDFARHRLTGMKDEMGKEEEPADSSKVDDR